MRLHLIKQLCNSLFSNLAIHSGHNGSSMLQVSDDIQLMASKSTLMPSSINRKEHACYCSCWNLTFLSCITCLLPLPIHCYHLFEDSSLGAQYRITGTFKTIVINVFITCQSLSFIHILNSILKYYSIDFSL